MLSDQELFNTVNKVTNTKSLFSMTGFSIKKSPYKNRRDELVSILTDGINIERTKAGYKNLSKKTIAIKINGNPFLSKDNGELELLINECRKKGNYKKFWWVINVKK